MGGRDICCPLWPYAVTIHTYDRSHSHTHTSTDVFALKSTRPFCASTARKPPRVSQLQAHHRTLASKKRQLVILVVVRFSVSWSGNPPGTVVLCHSISVRFGTRAGAGRPAAGCTPRSVIPVGHSSEATFLNSKLWRAPTPRPASDPRPATPTMVTPSALRRVLPYRWRPLRVQPQRAVALPMAAKAPMACRSPQASGVLLTYCGSHGDPPRRRQANVGWLQ